MTNEPDPESGSLLSVFWNNVKSDYASFDQWSANVFKSVGNAILHPVDTTVGAAGEVLKPVGSFFSGILWKLILILGLGLVLYLIFKDEIKELIK